MLWFGCSEVVDMEVYPFPPVAYNQISECAQQNSTVTPREIVATVLETSTYGLCFHRAFAAFFAMSVRCAAVSLSALALPPLIPPSRPRATAAGSFPWVALHPAQRRRERAGRFRTGLSACLSV